MNNFDPQYASSESLLEACQEEFPALSEDNLIDFFESLPSERISVNNFGVQRGDILIRRQYGHHEPTFYGVVEFVDDNNAFIFTQNGRKKVRLSKDGQRLDWELKRIRPEYGVLNISQTPFHLDQTHLDINSTAKVDQERYNDTPPIGGVDIVFEEATGVGSCFSIPLSTDPTASPISKAGFMDINTTITLNSPVPFDDGAGGMGKGGGRTTTSTLQVKGRLYYPAAVAGKDKAFDSKLTNLPLLIIVHGNHAVFKNPANRSDEGFPPGSAATWPLIANHLGYEYFQELLAQHGMVSFSVDCNRVTGAFPYHPNNINDRARLITTAIKHLDSLNKNPGRFKNTLNLKKIGLLGHSRGAEAVLLVSDMLSLPAFNVTSATVRGIISLAPTDITSIAKGVIKEKAFMTILPAADGDVVDNGGAKFYDQFDPFPYKTQLYIHGANHNYFNTEWVNDDFSRVEQYKLKKLNNPTVEPTVESFLTSLNSLILSKSTHKKILSVYGLAFFKDILLGQNLWRDILLGKKQTAGTDFAKIHISSEVSCLTTIDDFEDAITTKNSLFLPISKTSGIATKELSFIRIEPPSGLLQTFEHTFFGKTKGIVVEKTGSAGTLTFNTFPPFEVMEIWIRAAEVYNGKDIPPSRTAFEIGLEDEKGEKAFVNSNQTIALPRPFDRKERDTTVILMSSGAILNYTKTMLKTVRFPIACFKNQNSNLDGQKIKAIIIRHTDNKQIAYDQIQII